MLNTKPFLETVLQKIKSKDFIVILLAAILLSIPAKNIIGSISIIVFVLVSFIFFRSKINIKFSLLLPIVFYVLMFVSLLWTNDFTSSINSLQKSLPFLFIPLSFIIIKKISKIDMQKCFRIFSFGMVCYAIYYLLNAFYRYLLTGKIQVFFYHELVSKEFNAIYASVLTSFALIYFIAIKNKSIIEKAAISLLAILVLLLSSKSIITIDFILIIIYYSFFIEIPKSVKFATIISVFGFLLLSFLYVQEFRQRFLIEYQTAFVDNTVNNAIGMGNVYNVSLKQAWTLNKFEQNHFFPGTALRVYQARIFFELLQDEKILFTGFGVDASQNAIKKKTIQHNLYNGYGDFNFHNEYIQTFAEIGVFGFLILILMLFYNLKNAIRNNDFLHIAFAITMITLFLSESFFCRQRGIMFFIVLYCLFNSVENNLKSNQVD